MRGFGEVMQWMEGVERCELEGSGVGAVRSITMAGGFQIRERLKLDDAARSFRLLDRRAFPGADARLPRP